MMPFDDILTIGFLAIGLLAVCILFAILITLRQFLRREADRRDGQLEAAVRNEVEELLGDRMEEFEFRQQRQREELEERLEALLKKFGG